MDAAFAAFKKTAFLLSLALLAAVPRLAQAATPIFSGPTNTTVITLVSGAGSVSVTGSLDSSNQFIQFNVSVVYEGGDPAWLKVGSDSSSGPGGLCNGGTNTYFTPINLAMGIDCNAGRLSSGGHTALVTLTALSPAGVAAVTFEVSYNTGGGTGSTLVPTPSSLTGANAMAAAVGAVVSANVVLQTASASAIGFTVTTGATWLTVQSSTNQVSSSSSASLDFTASAAGLSAGAYNSTATVNYGNNQQLIINVTFNVGVGSVTLTPNALAWTFSSGALSPTSFQNTTLTTPNNDSYTAKVSYPLGAPATNWLLVNNNAISVSGLSNGSVLSISLANYGSLSAGTYTGTVTATDTANTNNSGTLTVTLTVSGSTSGNLTISPSPISLNSTNNYEQVVTVTSVSGGAFTVTPTPANSWLGVSLSANTIVAGGTALLTVTGNTSVSGSGTFSGSLSVTVGSVNQVVTVNLTAGSGAGGSSSGYVAPTTLNFVAESGGANVTQEIVFAGSGNFSISSAPTYSSNSGSVGWFASQSVGGNLSVQGTPVTIFASPKNLPAGTYTATVPLGLVVNGQAQQNVPSLAINFVVTSAAVLAANPSTVLLNNGAQNATVAVTSTGSTALPVSVTTDQNWLNATIENGVTTTPANISVAVSTSGLSNGMYAGNVLVTGGGAPTLYVPVVVVVTGATNPTGLTLSSPSLTFGAQAGGSAPASQTLTVSSSTATSFSATVSVTSPAGGSWLSINPKTNLTTNQALTVSVNQTGLATGTYSGTIALSANGATLNVPVNLVVNATGTTGGNITVSASSLGFSAVSGQAAPPTQTLTVSSSAGSAGVTFSAAASSTGNWLSVSPTSGTTQAMLTVSVNQASLSTGSHTGTITISPTGGSAVVVQVTLNVLSQPTITVTPESLSFAFQVGSGGSVTPGQLKVSATGGTANFQATATSTGNWLSVTPTSGSTSTSTTVTVQVNPAGLAASATAYTGTIAITGVSGTGGAVTVDVSLSVTAPFPNITAVLNAASYVNAPYPPVSPGEVVSIFGTSLGPTTPAFLTLDPTGTKVLTSIGGVQVSFSGYLAPLTYVSSTQINAIVPYELAGNKAPFVEVLFAGQTSNEPSLPLATTAPGIFTQNSSGTGPGAILNQNYQLNTQQNPAAAGSTIQIYMTGEGLTTPAQSTGAVTPVNATGVGPVTPAPQLAVSVMIGNQPAKVEFAGEAPYYVAGVLQVNADIPATAASGANSITVQIGKNISQNGVTVWVK